MLLRIGIVCVLLIVPWMLRGYVMTGMPLYPSTIGRVAFEWSVPAVQAETEAYCVRTMAQGYDLRWREAPRDWSWMSMWFDGLLYHRFTVVVPLLQGALLLAVAMVMFAPALRRGVRRSGWSVFVPVLPVAAALVFWFFAAPHPRFGNAQFVLFATAGVFACGGVLASRRSRVFAGRVLLVVTLFCVLPQAYYGISRRHKLKEISLTGVQPVPRAALRTIVTRSGLRVHVPVQGRLTWDAPLPAAPSVNPHLRLRVPGRLDRGFVGIRPEEWVDQI